MIFLDDGALIVTYNDHAEENCQDVDIITQGSIFKNDEQKTV